MPAASSCQQGIQVDLHPIHDRHKDDVFPQIHNALHLPLTWNEARRHADCKAYLSEYLSECVHELVVTSNPLSAACPLLLSMTSYESVSSLALATMYSL